MLIPSSKASEVLSSISYTPQDGSDGAFGVVHNCPHSQNTRQGHPKRNEGNCTDCCKSYFVCELLPVGSLEILYTQSITFFMYLLNDCLSQNWSGKLRQPCVLVLMYIGSGETPYTTTQIININTFLWFDYYEAHKDLLYVSLERLYLYL